MKKSVWTLLGIIAAITGLHALKIYNSKSASKPPSQNTQTPAWVKNTTDSAAHFANYQMVP